MAKPNNKPRVTGPDGIDYGALPVVGTLPPLLGPAPAAPEDEAKRPKSMVASVIDSGVAIGRGAVAGVKMFSDMVDPAGETSATLQAAQDWLTSKESPQRSAQREARAKKIKEAELSGSKLKEIGAYLGTLADAPLDTVLEGLATSAPTLGLSLIPGAGPAAVMARAGTMAAAGAGQGVGAARGRIYEDVQRAEIANGATPEQAQQRAAQAAQLTGPNGDQIALAGGLGALASTTGAERAVGMLARGAKPGVTPGVAARVLRGGLAEGATEAAQGGQEQFASNLAQQRAGFDTPLSQGVAGSAALEGAVGGVIGGGFALPRPRSGPLPATFIPEATQPTGLADQPTPTPGAAPSPSSTMADPEQALAAMHREANDNLASQKIWSRNNDRTPPAPDAIPAAAAGSPPGGVDPRGSAASDAGVNPGLERAARLDPADADLPASATGQPMGLPSGQSAADLADSIDWTHKTPQLNTPEAAQRQATRQNERTGQQWVVAPHPNNPDKWGVFPVKPQAEAAAPAPVEPAPAPAPAPAIPRLEDLPTPSNDQRFVLQSRIDADRKQLAATSPDSKAKIKSLRQAIATNEQALAALNAPPAAPQPVIALSPQEQLDAPSNRDLAPPEALSGGAPAPALASSVPGAEIVQGKGLAKGKVMAKLGNETSNMHDTVEQADAELRQTLALREKQANEAKALAQRRQVLADALRKGEATPEQFAQAGFTLGESMRQEDVSPFLVEHFPDLGFRKSRIRDLLGEAATTATTDMGATYNRVRMDRLSAVISRLASPARKPIVQNRNRATPSSIAQMSAIAGNPDYGRLGFSRDFANGAPVVAGAEIDAAALGIADTVTASDGRRIGVTYAVVEADSILASNGADGSPNADYDSDEIGALRAIAGNGRIAGLQKAYATGRAARYKEELAADRLHGIAPEAINAMGAPVLVRVMKQEDVTDDIGDVSNTTGNLVLSPVEQANNDAQRIDLEAMQFADNASIQPETVRQFVRAMPQAEQGGLIDNNGQPTKQAVDRLLAAIFAKTYGNDQLVRLYAQAQDPEARLILSALAQLAPKMARLEGSGGLDIRGIVTEAAELAINARREGVPLTRAAQQMDLGADPDTTAVLELFARNPRSAAPIVEALGAVADFAYTESNKPSADMFGEVSRATRAEVIDRLRQTDERASPKDLEEPAGREPAQQSDAGQNADPEGSRDGGGNQEGRPTEAQGQRLDNQGRDLDAVRRNFERLFEERQSGEARASQAFDEAAKRNPLPDWTTVDGVLVLRSGQSRFVGVPGAQPNADTYSTDLFGEPLPEAIGKPRAARSKRSAVPGNVDANASVPADTKRPAGEYLQRTAIGISGMRELGRSHIHDYYDLATATAYLSNSAVERLDGVVTDADGKVLAIVGGFKGAVAQAAVYLDTMMAEAIRIPGAANLWLSHNHPSGTASLSMGDLNLMESAARLFDPAGIKVRGIAAVAIDKFAFAEPGKGGPAKQIGDLTIGSDFKKTRVPSIERVITQQAERNRPAVGNPSAARQIASQAYAKAKQPVILFLDAQLSLISVVPIPADARGQLKYTEALKKIYRASAETTTGAAIIAHGGELDTMVSDGDGKPIAAAINIASAIQAIEVRALDIITIRPNSAPSSLADSGLNVTAPVWYSLRNAPNPELTALRFAGEVLLELSNNAGAFAFPISKSRTVQGVVEDIQPEFTYEGNVATEDERNESGADEKHAIRNTMGKEAFIYLTKGEVWIDVSRFKPGQGGQAIYAMAGDLAKNTGRVFIGDPAGLSTDALRRRTEAMLSSALRHGTTTHLEPHENQTKGDPAAGVKPLKWSTGDDAKNIESLIGATLDNVRATFPEVDSYEYDFDTGQFRDKQSGSVISGDGFEIGANRSAGARAALAGSRTLKRAAFIQSLLRAPSESRPQLLEFALRSNDSQLGLLRGLFSLAKRGRTAAPATDKESLTVDQALAPLRQSLILDGAQRGFDPVGLEGLKVASMTAEQRSLTKRLSSLFGIDIVLVDGDQGLAPEQQFNGVFAGGKTLYVSATAEKPFQWVVGHEFTHYMRLRSPALYDAMLERLAPYLRAQAVQRYAKAKMAGLAANAPLDRGIEEAMGDLMGDAWVRPEFWATLRTHDESLFQQVARLFREFVAALRRALGATTKPQGVAADLLKDTEAALEVLRSVVADAALPAAGPQPSAQPAAAARSGALGPLWVSELRRQIAVAPKAQPAEQWRNWLKGLGAKGVKPDEIEWSGIPEFLDMAQGKVTREQLLGVLNDEGVHLLDTVNNVDQFTGPDERSARQRARARLEYEGIEVSFEQGLDTDAGPDIEVAFEGTTYTFDPDGHNGPWFYDAGDNSLSADAGQLVSDAYNMGLSADEAGLEFSGVFAGQLEPRTQYQAYAAPGAATNYQEILIRMPGNLYSSGHWGGKPNVLAHVRVDTRVDVDGKKVLFVNEIQSDWAQEGRKLGFGPKNTQVASAPFIKATDKWVGLAIKRIIRAAAEQRVDKVAFISGQQAADLYQLDRRVSKITAHRWDIEGYGPAIDLKVFDLDGQQIYNEDAASLEQVERLLGKDLAEKIAAMKPEARQEFTGEALRFGGRGMKEFYDTIVPKVAKEVLRKLGNSSLDKTVLPASKPAALVFDTQGADATTLLNRADMVIVEGGAAPEVYGFAMLLHRNRPLNEALEKLTIESAERLGIKAVAAGAPPSSEVISFDITPALRERALAGMPLFSSRAPAPQFSLRGQPASDKNLERNSAGTSPKTLLQHTTDAVSDLFTTTKKFNWWHKTVGTQAHKAKVDPQHYGRTFDLAMEHYNDVSRLANEAADLAPDLLPRLDGFGDLFKRNLSDADRKAIAAPIFDGTLKFRRAKKGDRAKGIKKGDPVDADVATAGIIWTPAELTERYSLNDQQIGYYQQFRAAVDLSIDQAARADIIRFTADKAAHLRPELLATKTAADAARIIREEFSAIADLLEKSGDAQSASVHRDLIDDVHKKLTQAKKLSARGYAPLMRFGRYAVDILSKQGEREGFMLYESEAEANRAARAMRKEYPESDVVQSILSEDAYKLFSGASLETIELMATLSNDQDGELMQAFIKEARANHSAIKRLLHRKGIEGYSEDITRVLSSFLTSQARATSNMLHLGELTLSVKEIPQHKGDVKDEAAKLVRYIQDPQEEAQTLRGILFIQFIGGSVASALTNMTQPLTMTFPYLAKFGGAARASGQLLRAMKDIRKGATLEPDLKEALARAETEGVVSPQEIHQLQAEAMRTLTGSAGKGRRALRKGLWLWGSLFSLAEQFNRRVTFIAAYRTAQAQGIGNPFAFAEQAIYDTQGIYNKVNRPNWARGAIGGTVFTFKQFSIAYMEFLAELPRPQKALALAVLMLAAGMQGLPGADDLDDIIDTIAQRLGYAFNSKQAKREFIVDTLGASPWVADFVLRGFSAIPGVPIDVQARMGLGNIIPGTGLGLISKPNKTDEVFEVLGPAGGLVRNVMNRGAEGLWPVAMANAKKGWDMYQTGMYRDEGGRRVMDTDGFDAAMKAIGFQPAEVGRASASVRTLNQTIMLAKQMEARFASDIAGAIFERDAQAAKDARQRLAQWNKDNPETPIRITEAQINRRVMEMRASRDERFIKRTPRELRAGVERALRATGEEATAE